MIGALGVVSSSFSSMPSFSTLPYPRGFFLCRRTGNDGYLVVAIGRNQNKLSTNKLSANIPQILVLLNFLHFTPKNRLVEVCTVYMFLNRTVINALKVVVQDIYFDMSCSVLNISCRKTKNI